MPRQHKVHELLSRDELDALEAFAREPGRSVDECHEWMQAHGYTLARSSVGRWKEEFDLEDKIRRSAVVSRQYLEVAKDAGVEQIASASLMKFQQLVFEHLLTADERDAGELMKIAIAMKTALGATQIVESLKRRFDEQVEAAKAKRPGGTVTADDLEKARKQIFGS